MCCIIVNLSFNKHSNLNLWFLRVTFHYSCHSCCVRHDYHGHRISYAWAQNHLSSKRSGQPLGDTTVQSHWAWHWITSAMLAVAKHISSAPLLSPTRACYMFYLRGQMSLVDALACATRSESLFDTRWSTVSLTHRGQVRTKLNFQ